LAEFEARVTKFLAEGASRDERLVLITDDPRVDQWPEQLVQSGQLLIASTADTYGPSRIVDAAAQRAVFASVLSDAQRDGYTGIRLAADNTSMIRGSERQQAWMTWEKVADELMAENPFTGLCAFDRRHITADDVTFVRNLHHIQAPA
jgi:hypothetical protein